MPIAFDQATLSTYFEVIMINLILSGDNVIVIGMAAASLSADLRRKAIVAGIAAAAAIRVVFALIAARLLHITGIQLIGGLLLLWVCWTMFGELTAAGHGDGSAALLQDDAPTTSDAGAFRSALFKIVIADVSMSLDNVLAVAGAASDNFTALVFGLILSVLLMGVASSLVASLLNRYRWISWLGLLIILYVAGEMIYEGSLQVAELIA